MLNNFYQYWTEPNKSNFAGYEFMDFEKIKCTKNKKIMIVLDEVNSDGKKYAVTVSPKYLQKILSTTAS